MTFFFKLCRRGRVHIYDKVYCMRGDDLDKLLKFVRAYTEAYIFIGVARIILADTSRGFYIRYSVRWIQRVICFSYV